MASTSRDAAAAAAELAMQQTEQVILNTRQELHKLALNYQNLHLVTTEYRAHGTSSPIYKFISALGTLAKQYQHIYSLRPILTDNELESVTSFNEDDWHAHLSYGFTEWIVSFILRILNHDVKELHEECRSSMIKILKMLRISDPAAFSRLTRQLCNLLDVLREYADGLFSSRTNPQTLLMVEHFHLTQKLLSLLKQNSKYILLEPIPLTVVDQFKAEQLEIHIFHILNGITREISDVTSDCWTQIWKVACFNLCHSDLPMKTVSLDCLSQLMKHDLASRSNPQFSEGLSHIYSHLEGCFEGEMYTFGPEHYPLFQKSLANNLLQVCNTLEKDKFYFPLHKLTFPSLIEDLLKCIEKYKLTNVTSEELLLATFHMIPVTLEYTKKHGGYPFMAYATLFRKVFTTIKDDLPNGKSLIPMLLFVIKEELKFFKEYLSIKNNIIEQTKGFSVTWKDVDLTLQKCLEKREASQKAQAINLITTCLTTFLHMGAHLYLETTPSWVVFDEAAVATLEPVLTKRQSLRIIMYLSSIANDGKVFNFEVYERMYDLLHLIASYPDLVPLNQKAQQKLCILLSLPEIAKTENNLFYDLPFENQVVPQFWKLLKPLKSLDALALLPLSLAPEWRLEIFKRAFQTKGELYLSAVKNFPIFISQIGPIEKSDLQHILELLSGPENAPEYLSAFYQHQDLLWCSIDQDCQLIRSSPSTLKLVCLVCNQTREKNVKSGADYNNIFIRCFAPKEDYKLYLAMIPNITTYFNHFELCKETSEACLACLIESKDYEVNLKFSAIISCLLPDHTHPEAEHLTSLLLTSVHNVFDTCKNTRLLSNIETTLIATCELAYSGQPSLVSKSLLIIIECHFSGRVISAIAKKELQKLSQKIDISLPELYRCYQKPICDLLSRLALKLGDATKGVRFLGVIGGIFEYDLPESFLKVIMGHILANLALQVTPVSASLIQELSLNLSIAPRTLIMDHFQYIFPHLIITCDETQFSASLKFMEEESGITVGSLLRCSFQLIHNELLRHIGDHYEKVFVGLSKLAENFKDYNGPRPIQTKEQMAEFLHPRMLGYITFYDQVLNSRANQEDKLQILDSINSLMILMGPTYITGTRMKLMATLRIALRYKCGELPQKACKVWLTYVQNIEDNSLSTVLSHILVALLSHLSLDPEGVARVYEYLIVHKEELLKDHLSDLYFIPQMAILNKVNRVLKPYLDKILKLDFQTVLNHYKRGLNHESLEVRLQALLKVTEHLAQNQQILHEHLKSREQVDPLISQLISKIIPHCKETDERWSLALAECLGQLGAIDPGRLDIKGQGPQERDQRFFLSIEDDNFALYLLIKFIQTYQAAEMSKVQDCYAFAIQELLQVYEFTKETSPGYSLWNQLPLEYHDIIKPLLTSRYKISQEVQVSKKIIPIYGSALGSTFEDWINSFAALLYNRVCQLKASQIFHSCSMVCKYDIKSAILLLPYLLLYTVEDSSEDGLKDLVLEFKTVLKQTCDDDKKCHRSAQAVFDSLDYLNGWVRRQQRDAHTNREIAKRSAKVKSFLDSIPFDLMAQSAYKCRAYSRALMFLELYFNHNPDQVLTNLDFLQKIYVSLDDVDGALAVSRLCVSPTIEMQIQIHEAKGQNLVAYCFYERVITQSPNNWSLYSGLLKCHIAMSHFTTIQSYASGLIKERPEWTQDILPFQIEASWKLSQWNELENFLNEPAVSNNSTKWEYGMGRLLLSVHKQDYEAMKIELMRQRLQLMVPLAAAASEEGAYIRGYHFLLRLHMLTDLENIFTQLLYPQKGTLPKNSLIKELKGRWQLVESSLKHRTPILGLQKTLLQIAHEKCPEIAQDIQLAMAQCCLYKAKLSRKNGDHQQAYNYLLDAETVRWPKVFIEKAKWYWNKDSKDEALRTLRTGIEDFFQDHSPESVPSTQSFIQLLGKARLLLAQYSDEAGIQVKKGIGALYLGSIHAYGEWEESFFQYASYLDRVKNDFVFPEFDVGQMLIVIKNYSASLRFGCKHIAHSLARIFTLWFDFSNFCLENQEKIKKGPHDHKRSLLVNTTPVVHNNINHLPKAFPLYYLLTALPQLVSRICHESLEVRKVLDTFIAQLLVTFPQQAIWKVIAVSKSSHDNRSRRCVAIFHKAAELNPDFVRMITDATSLTDKLIELCNKRDNIHDTHIRSMDQFLPSLKNLMKNSEFGPILLPYQSFMTVSLPNNTNASTHNPFPQNLVYINSFLDPIELLMSLQRPKKITIRGSDGNVYNMLCKPKDDLRKDGRLMDFNNLVSSYLKQDAEARNRQLHIRTYAVTPLNEECGLIEWVPNLTTLRSVVNNIYKDLNILITTRELKSHMCKPSDSLDVKLNTFRNRLITKHPPVLAKWFLSNFSDPTAWYHAKLAYIRTTAVMSIIGYLLGLGDRHGENILFDSSSGDIVHVDFNCLFNKGETFDCPERVPFRLTHNMVDAMGILGYNGSFRKTCEVTLAVVRSHKDSLLSVLQPFIHDPLLEWTKGSRIKAPLKGTQKEPTNSRAVELLKNIEDRLSGKVNKKQPGSPGLSIEGHVDFLIKEATSEENLCQMYLGWAPFV